MPSVAGIAASARLAASGCVYRHAQSLRLEVVRATNKHATF